MTLFADFETRSPIEIKAGVETYLASSECDYFMLAIAVEDGDATQWLFFAPLNIGEPETLTKYLPPGCRIFTKGNMAEGHQAVRELIDAGHNLVAHNAVNFDALVWDKFGFPTPQRPWDDTMYRARYAGLPGGLDLAGLILTDTGKDKKGAALLKTFYSPLKEKAPVTETRWQVTEILGSNGVVIPSRPFGIVSKYCVKDVEVLHAIAKKLPELPEFERGVVKVDTAINARGIEIHGELATAIGSLEDGRVDLAFDSVATAVFPTLEAQDARARTKKFLQSPAQLKKWFAGLHPMQGVGTPMQAYLLKFEGTEGAEGDGEARPVDEAPKLVPAKLEDTQRNTLERVLEHGYASDTARLVIAGRLQASRITGRKARRAIEATAIDGRLRYTLAYHAAHTARWGGRVVQPQNFKRPPQKFEAKLAVDAAIRKDWGAIARMAEEWGSQPDDVLGSLLRCLFIAGDGMVFVDSDFAAVEARGVALAAKELGLLQQFRIDDDVYCRLAERIYGVPVGTFHKSTHKDERQLGKIGILGCGYGMSGPKLQMVIDNMRITLPEGITAASIVETYRGAYPAIAGRYKGVWRDKDNVTRVARSGGLWKDLERVFKSVTEEGGAQRCGRCTIRRQGRDTLLELPSGRAMTYRNMRLEDVVPTWGGNPRPSLVFDSPRGWDNDGNHKGTGTYGGKLAENLVQAMCRDILCDSMIKIEREVREYYGQFTLHGIVLHVHDSVLLQVPEVDGEYWKGRVVEIMSTAPDWLDDFPLSAEASLVHSFGG